MRTPWGLRLEGVGANLALNALYLVSPVVPQTIDDLALGATSLVSEFLSGHGVSGVRQNLDHLVVDLGVQGAVGVSLGFALGEFRNQFRTDFRKLGDGVGVDVVDDGVDGGFLHGNSLSGL